MDHRGAPQFIRTESDDVVDAESFTNRFRAGRYVTKRLDFFAMHGYLRDTFSGIDHRNTITFGLGYADREARDRR